MSRKAVFLSVMLHLTACSSSTQYMIARVQTLEAEKRKQDAVIEALRTQEAILSRDEREAKFDIRKLNSDNFRLAQENARLQSVIISLQQTIEDRDREIRQLFSIKEEMAYICGSLAGKLKNKEHIEPCVNYHKAFLDLKGQLKKQETDPQKPRRFQKPENPQGHPRQAPGLS